MRTPNHLIAPIARAIQAMVSAPGLRAADLNALCKLDVSEMAGKMPTAFWLILGHAIPMDLQGEIESAERLNWAAVVKIAALFKRGIKNPLATVDSIGTALRQAGISERRLQHLLDTASNEDMRLLLVDCARQVAEKRSAFSIEEAAELLLSSCPERCIALQKLENDWQQ